MSARRKPASIDEYLALMPDDVRDILEEIRRNVHAAVPQAQETMAYQMPAFKLDKVFFQFGGFEKHIGIYPPVHGDHALRKQVSRYRGENGNLKIPLDEPIPFALITRIAVTLAEEYGWKTRIS